MLLHFIRVFLLLLLSLFLYVLRLGCSGLAVSTCQMIGCKDSSDEVEEIIYTKTRLKSVHLFICVANCLSRP